MSAGVTGLGKFAYLLNRTQDLHFRENRDKVETFYDKYTKAGDTSEADFRSATTVGFGQMGLTGSVEGFVKDQIEPGTERITTWHKFTIGTLIDEDFYEDAMKSKRTRKGASTLLKNISQEFIESSQWTRDVITALFMTQGTSATKTTLWPGAGRDGMPLFSTTHTSTKSPQKQYSNLMTGASLSQLSLQESISMLDKIPSEEGRPQAPVKDVVIVYGRYNEWRIPEILKTDMKVDSDLNNVNTLHHVGRRYTPLMLPYLPDTFTGWMVMDKKNHQLHHFLAAKPEMFTERDIHTGAYIKRMRMRYGIDFLSYKGVVLNPGI